MIEPKLRPLRLVSHGTCDWGGCPRPAGAERWSVAHQSWLPVCFIHSEIGIDTTTREFCGRCHRVSPVGFHSPNSIWEAVAGRHWKNEILCIVCFAALGDEKHIVWEEGIEFYPVSYATHHKMRVEGFPDVPGPQTLLGIMKWRQEHGG